MFSKSTKKRSIYGKINVKFIHLKAVRHREGKRRTSFSLPADSTPDDKRLDDRIGACGIVVDFVRRRF